MGSKDGVFFEKVKRGQVVGPRRRDFSPESWKAAADTYGLNSIEDQNIYDSGLFIHSKFEAIRKELKKSTLPDLTTDARVKSLLALVNHQLVEIIRKFNANVANDASKDDSVLHIGELMKTKIRMADGVETTGEKAISNMLDGVLLPLVFALHEPGTQANDGFEKVNWSHVAHEVNLGIIYGQVEGLWEDLLWNSYMAVKVKALVIAMPINRASKIGFIAASARKNSLGVEAIIHAKNIIELDINQALIPKILEVKDVTYENGKQRINFGSQVLDVGNCALLMAFRHVACPPYYENLFSEPQKILQGLSLSQLMDGWMVASRVATILYEKVVHENYNEADQDSDTPLDMRQFIPSLSRDSLNEALVAAASLTEDQAEVVIDFLTFRAERGQTLWTQPLICTGEAHLLYPVFGSLTIPPTPRFLLETWMAQLKIKLERRGPAFESHLRERLTDAAAASSMLQSISQVLQEDWTFRCDGGSSQIDAMFHVGKKVFVVEAKCILEPTDSNSAGTHRTAVEHAVHQARHRVLLIENHRNKFIKEMNILGWNLPEDFKVHPLVALSTVAHVGVPFEDVPIVDVYVLEGFFRGGYVEAEVGDQMGVVGERRRSYYSTAEEAEACAEYYFRNPPQLQTYSERMEIITVPFHPVGEGDWRAVVVDFQ